MPQGVSTAFRWRTGSEIPTFLYTLRFVYPGYGKKLLEKLSEVEAKGLKKPLQDWFLQINNGYTLYTPPKIKIYLTVLRNCGRRSPLPDACSLDTGHLTVMSPIADVSYKEAKGRDRSDPP
jgi:hypothetical protein